MRYVIVGNGVAGVTAAFTIRERSPDAQILIISGESDYFFSRTALMYAFLDRLALRDLEPYERSIYGKKQIGLIRAWVQDLNANRNELALSDGQRIEYDCLLLATGSSPKKPEWAGLQQRPDGVVHFVSLQDLAECERVTARSRQAVVVGGGLIGVELVECLRHFGLEVTFLVREPWYWPAALFQEEAQMVTKHLENHGVRVALNEEVSEVLCRDGTVRAVRTQSGREYSCEMLGITIGVEPAVSWLRSVTTPPKIGKGIRVDASFRTSLPGVFAAGDCAEHGFVEQLWYSAKRQGALAGRAMLGESVRYTPPLFFNSAKFFEIEYTTVGQVTKLPEDAGSWYYRIPNREASVRIITIGGRVAGFNMLGSRWNHAVLEQWIHDGLTLEQVKSRLPEAQFDVEFGRMPLEVRS
jgi:NAD(P)H-nitrite reductase large subunit